jgi:hypothetical protein
MWSVSKYYQFSVLLFQQVNLKKGAVVDEGVETCTAGAGSLLLELGALSRLVGDPIYESMARRANRALWSARAKNTGLLGNPMF